MAFRLTTLKTLSQLCSSTSKTVPAFKKATSMTFKQATPTIYYTQSRGYIFFINNV